MDRAQDLAQRGVRLVPGGGSKGIGKWRQQLDQRLQIAGAILVVQPGLEGGPSTLVIAGHQQRQAQQVVQVAGRGTVKISGIAAIQQLANAVPARVVLGQIGREDGKTGMAGVPLQRLVDNAFRCSPIPGLARARRAPGCIRAPSPGETGE